MTIEEEHEKAYAKARAKATKLKHVTLADLPFNCVAFRPRAREHNEIPRTLSRTQNPLNFIKCMSLLLASEE